MSDKASKQLYIPLMQNALDFIDKGLSEFKEYEKNDIKLLKYVTLHVHAGIELILKARLINEHWSFVFKDLDKASQESYQNGDFISIDMVVAFKRLKNLCDIEIDAAFEQACNDLRKKRNKIDHFEMNESIETLIGCVVKVLVGIIDFLRTEFDEKSISAEENKILDRIKSYLLENQKYILVKLTAIAPKLSTVENVIKCPQCGQKTFVLDEGEELCECYFCNYKSTDYRKVADAYVENVLNISAYSCAKDGEPWPVTSCIECGLDSFVDVPGNYICFNCKKKFEDEDVVKCEVCGNTVCKSSGDESNICYDCYNAIEYKA